jgi:putative sigma-54 modulation protein
MNVQFHFFGLNANERMREMVLPDLAQLDRHVSVSSAVVVFDRTCHGGSAFTARAHLAVPGPDIHAEAHDHTLQAAWRKVRQSLEKQISRRKTKQAERLKSNRQQSISSARWSRQGAPR